MTDINSIRISHKSNIQQNQKVDFAQNGVINKDINDTFKSFYSTSNSVIKKDILSPMSRKLLFAAMSPITPFRRVASFEDNVKDQNYIRAAGLGALALINLPEDCNDLKGATKQINNKLLPSKLKECLRDKYPKFHKKFIDYKPYDYKNYQHNFSFFKGTMLEPLLKIPGQRGKKIAKKLHNLDTNLLDTKLGRLLKKIFRFDYANVEPLYTGRSYGYKKGIKVYARQFKGSAFGQLLGRSLTRIPTLSLLALSLLELPAIVKAAKIGENTKEKIKSTAKQLTRSFIFITTLFAGIGMGGAYMSKKFGSIGSLIGMGLGAMSGAFVSNKINKQVDKL